MNIGEEYEQKTRFHINCILICAIHPTFMIVRLPIFIIYTLLTCCCNKENRLFDGFPVYKERMISFEYIDRNEGLRAEFGVDDRNFRNPI